MISADRAPAETKDVKKEAYGYGSPLACQWLEAHAQQIANAEAAKAKRESDERATAASGDRHPVRVLVFRRD